MKKLTEKISYARVSYVDVICIVFGAFALIFAVWPVLT